MLDQLFQSAGVEGREEGLVGCCGLLVALLAEVRLAQRAVAVLVPAGMTGGGREQPDMILVCGGCANIPGVSDLIASRVGIPTLVGDPLGQMKISSKAKAQGVKRDATALLTAFGLALRSFD